MGLLFAESSFFYAAFDKILQPAKHFPKVAGNAFIKGFQRFDILCREQGAGFLMNIRLRFVLIQQRHTAYIPPECVEVGIGQAASFKKRLCRSQYSGQIPGNEIQVPAIQASGPAQEGHRFRSRIPQDGIPQVIPEVQNGVAPLLAGKTF